MRLTHWLSIFCSFLLLSCERTIPFPEMETAPLLVVNAFITPDTTWQVTLSQSSPIDSMVTFIPVLNGQVNILDLTTNQTIALSHQKKGLYIAPTPLPQVNHTYQLTASANGFSEASATTTIPSTPQVQLNKYRASTFQNQANYLFDLSIDDNPGAINFYLIEIQYILETPTQLLTENATHFSFDSNSDNETIVVDHQNLKRSYLTDENFNGATYTTQIGASSPLLKMRTNTDILKAVISIKSINEAGYLYLKSVERFENVEDQIFAEPPSVCSKIENGLGIFAGYSVQQIEVVLP